MPATIDDKYRRVIKNAVQRNVRGERHIVGIFALLSSLRYRPSNLDQQLNEAKISLGSSRSIRAFNIIAEKEGYGPLLDSSDYQGITPVLN